MYQVERRAQPVAAWTRAVPFEARGTWRGGVEGRWARGLTAPADKRTRQRAKGRDVRFELFRERLLVEKKPRVPELPVEPVLKPPDTLHRIVQVAVAREHEQRRVRAPRQERVGVPRAQLPRHVVLVRDGPRGSGAPRELRRDVLEGCRAAIVFVREAEDRVQADLSWERGVADANL